LAQEFDDARQKRNDYDDNNNKFEVILNEGNVAEEIASKNKSQNPNNASSNVIDGKSPI
jgi:hypothetical protein